MLKVFVFLLSASFCAALLQGPHIWRPCGLRDLACLRSVLNSRARCAVTPGRAPPVLKVPESRFNAASFNASYVDKNMIIRGLDRCFVSEFYLNRQTKGGVVAIDCPDLNIQSDRVMYQHYPRQEDGIFRYKIRGTYPLLTFTTSLSSTEPINFCREFSDAYVWALPNFQISVYNKPTSDHLTRDLSMLLVFEQETFAERANTISRAVLNNMLCNCGCA